MARLWASGSSPQLEQVTAYGSGNAQCKVEFWEFQTVNVRCFSPSGALVDARFYVMLGS